MILLIRKLKRNREIAKLQGELEDPDLYARKNKHYFPAHKDPSLEPWPIERFLPTVLEEGVPAPVPFSVGDDVVTAGGRVLCATALGNTVTEAQQRAYELAKKISWNGMFYRNDIAYRAIAREQS